MHGECNRPSSWKYHELVRWLGLYELFFTSQNTYFCDRILFRYYSALTPERQQSWVQVCCEVARFLLKADGTGCGDCGETEQQLVLCIGILVITGSGRLSWHQAIDPSLPSCHRYSKLRTAASLGFFLAPFSLASATASHTWMYACNSHTHMHTHLQK